MNLNHQTIRVARAKTCVIKAALQMQAALQLVWGSSALGLHLTGAHFSGRDLTTEELAELCGVSSETVRRWLKPLLNVDRVRMIKEGRNVRYKAREEWANRTAENLLKTVDSFVEERDTYQDVSTGLVICGCVKM